MKKTAAVLTALFLLLALAAPAAAAHGTGAPDRAGNRISAGGSSSTRVT